MRTKVVALMVAALIPVSAIASGAFGSQGPVDQLGHVQQTRSLDQFRQDLEGLIQAYEDCPAANLSTSVGLDERVAELSDTDLGVIYAAIPDPQAFSEYIDTIQAWCHQEVTPTSGAGGATRSPSPAEGAEAPYPPDYPQGNNTDAFRATLPGLGILDNGPTNRTDTNAVAGDWIAIETFKAADIVLETACNVVQNIPDFGISSIAACGAAGLSKGLTFAAQIVLDQADFQDSNVDAAEIEAGYENTVKLLRRTDRLEALLYEVIRLLNTPESRRSSSVPACGGHACLWPER